MKVLSHLVRLRISWNFTNYESYINGTDRFYRVTVTFDQMRFYDESL